MENSISVLTTVGAHEGQSVSIAGGAYRIVISGEQTAGAYAVIEMLVPPGGGPTPHAHAGFQEAFYILEGEVEVKTETLTYTAQTGAYVNIPTGGMVHCFKNKADKNARLLCTVVPAGLENFFLEIGQPITYGEILPPPPMDAEAMKKLQAIAEKYGQKLYPPDYLDKK
ncbi:hypothetical protein GCM10023149_10940 [Mucilaginibacter gynuensis]|uniref:Cupin type-2 domain-containing protein n=1 Tax=Mucilaginibacter gynuensis TaxID=1302236 RepID=A0ABP8G0T8_9SPHI